ncbi:MAG: 50S ribosomal protein L29 [Thermoplasmata archaeon]|nr:50S ribosomal protein L29 [Thermoplasmata archaeon]
MTLLRMKELRALPEEELRRKIAEIENDLLRERGIAAMGGAPPSPGRMRALRTNVARSLTVLSERENAARRSATPRTGVAAR